VPPRAPRRTTIAARAWRRVGARIVAARRVMERERAHGGARCRFAALFALLLCVSAAMAQPAPLRVHTESVRLDGWNVAVDVYEPSTVPAAGVAIIAHGFMRDRSRHRALGEDLAAAGVIAVVPDLPHVMDHWGNGAALAELANQLEAGTLGLRPVARSDVVLIGTSAGGLASVVAASKLPGLAGWIGLDPVDRTGTGATAAARLAAPAVVLLGGASQCNLLGSGRALAHAVPRLIRSTKLKDASHCDFEDPTNKFCEVMCGAASPQMQARIREEAVSAALELLRDRDSAP
jgi:pimeloyl-ACP methyl ester carboxylesterase